MNGKPDPVSAAIRQNLLKLGQFYSVHACVLHTVQISPVRCTVTVIVDPVAAPLALFLATGGDAPAAIDIAGGLEKFRKCGEAIQTAQRASMRREWIIGTCIALAWSV